MCFPMKMQYINVGINLIEWIIYIINTPQLFGIKMERKIDIKCSKFLIQNLGKGNDATEVPYSALFSAPCSLL